jgi:hypothetical protein
MDKEKPIIDNGIQQAREQRERQQRRQKLSDVEVALFKTLGIRTRKVVRRQTSLESEQQIESD